MSIGEEYPTSGNWSITKVIGIVLILLGIFGFAWVLWGAHQLFTQGTSFQVLDGMVPAEIAFSHSASSLLLPREVLVYGIPLFLLSLVTKLGGTLLKWGLDCLEIKKRKP